MHATDEQGRMSQGPDNMPDEGSRRELLAKIGRFAYVAPALTLLSEPGAALGQYRPGFVTPPVVRPPVTRPRR